MNISNDLYQFVKQPEPIDLASIRDPGMKCLVHLAVSLGWNVHQKRNQPVVITAKDGHQKRLPTTTSIRMSVFQTALSSIMVHTDEMVIPTIELIDAIIAMHKPPVDHQRRLRLAVGETPTQHRERVASAEAEVKGARDPQPLTTRIEIPEEQWDMVKDMIDGDEEEVAARAAADGGEHGEVVSREPYKAVKASTAVTTVRYISDTSYERKWADDYVDYECMKCGKAFPTSKGVGSHSQVHGPAGDKKAWQRNEVITREPRVMPGLEWEEPPGEETVNTVEREEPGIEQELIVMDEPVLTNANDSFILGQIAALVVPDLVAKIQMLTGENEFLRDRLEEVEGEFDAFLDLAASRRKKADGD